MSLRIFAVDLGERKPQTVKSLFEDLSPRITQSGQESTTKHPALGWLLLLHSIGHEALLEI